MGQDTYIQVMIIAIHGLSSKSDLRVAFQQGILQYTIYLCILLSTRLEDGTIKTEIPCHMHVQLI